jgi:hypothetical protein
MACVYTMFTSIKMDRKSTMVLTSVTLTIRIICATATQHQIEYTKLTLHIISKAEEMWDVQERDGYCEVETGLTLEKMMISTYKQQSFTTSQYFLSKSRNYPRFMKTSSLLHPPNIFLSTLFSKILSPCSSLNVRD